MAVAETRFQSDAQPSFSGLFDLQGKSILAAALLLAALLSLPVVSVAANLLWESGPVWQHLIDKVLVNYISNSAILAAEAFASALSCWACRRLGW